MASRKSPARRATDNANASVQGAAGPVETLLRAGAEELARSARAALGGNRGRLKKGRVAVSLANVGSVELELELEYAAGLRLNGDWETELAPLETDAERQARIKAFWPSFVSVTQAVGDAAPDARKIRRLMLYIAGMESTFGLSRDQLPRGPAKGLLQIQNNKLKDIILYARVMDRQNLAGRKNRLNMLTATQDVYADEDTLHAATEALPGSDAYPIASPFKGLARDNDTFAAMLLRLQLMRGKAMPGDHEKCHEWWKSDWHGPTNLPDEDRAKFLALAKVGDSDLKVLRLD